MSFFQAVLELFRPEAFRTQKVLLVLAGCLAASPGVSGSDDESVFLLDRTEAVEISLSRSSDLMIALEEVERARGGRIVQRAPGVPSLSVTGGYEIRDSGLIDRAPDSFQDEDPGAIDPPPDSEVPISRESLRLQGEVRQLLFAGFEQFYRGRSADRDVKAALFDARDVANTTVRDARIAFENTLLRRDSVVLREERLGFARRLEDLVQERFEGGQAIEFQVAQAEINRSQAEVDLKRAEIEYEDALARLADQVGLKIEPGQVLRVEGELRPEIENLPDFVSRREALKSSWRIRSLALSADSARLAAMAEKATLSPRLEGYANYQYNSSYYDFEDRLHGWAAGLTVSWGLFDGFARRGRVRAALAEKRSTEWRQMSFTDSFIRRYENLRSELERGLEMLRTEERGVELAGRSLDQTREMFALGRIDVETAVRSEEQVLETRLRRLEAVYRLNVAWFQYLALTGADDSMVVEAVR